MTALAQRRGACPALSAPMQTGDGLLVRLNPVAGGLPPAALIGLCLSAARHGNGIVEITQRGSIQIRGLTAQSAGLLADDVNALGIAIHTGVPVETSSLAGLDPDEIADPRPIADAIRAAVRNAGLSHRLGPKVSVVVDGGGRIAMDDLLADVRLGAVAQGSGTLWHVAVGGTAVAARPVDLFAEADARQAAIAILEAIAERGPEGRGRDLKARQLETLRSVAPPSGAPPSVLPDISPTRGEIKPAAPFSPISNVARDGAIPKLPISPPVGEMSGRTEGDAKECEARRLADRPKLAALCIFPLTNATHTLGIALPFGSMPAGRIAELAREAANLGATEIRPAPGRILLVLGLTTASAAILQAKAAALGFVIDAADPRLHIAACPGKPACASGHIETRAMAERFARQNTDLLDGSFALHISGCAKGCAHPAPSALALVGGENGAGLVVNGTANATPSGYIAGDRTAHGFNRVAALVAKERGSGETAAACLARLGGERVAQVFATGQQGQA